MSLAPGQPMSPDAKSPPDNPTASNGSGVAIHATPTPATAPREAQFPPDVEAQRPALAATETHVEAVSDAESEPPAVNSRAKPTTKRVFGLQRQYRTHAAAGNDPHNYEQKYPPDEIGEELGPNARVWRVYLDEAEAFDSDMINSWKDTIDVLLVFAGLFSAVVTTLVVQTSQALQPDYSMISASLLTELVSLQRAISQGASTDAIPVSHMNSTSPFRPSANDRWVNGLWFTTLAINLATALLSVLVKQWLQNYVSAVSGTARTRVQIRQFRFRGLEKWHVQGIIGMLPVLMHLSLLVFLIGLVVFLRALDIAISWVITGTGIMAYLAYFISNLLPLAYMDCPYRTPLSDYVYIVYHNLLHIWHLASNKSVHVRYFLYRLYIRGLAFANIVRSEQSGVEVLSEPRIVHVGTRELFHNKEYVAINKESEVLETNALTWLYKSSNPTITSIFMQSLAGIQRDHGDFKAMINHSFGAFINDDLLQKYKTVIESSYLTVKDQDGVSLVERLLRGYLYLFQYTDWKGEAPLSKGIQWRIENWASQVQSLELKALVNCSRCHSRSGDFYWDSIQEFLEQCIIENEDIVKDHLELLFQYLRRKAVMSKDSYEATIVQQWPYSEPGPQPAFWKFGLFLIKYLDKNKNVYPQADYTKQIVEILNTFHKDNKSSPVVKVVIKNKYYGHQADEALFSYLFQYLDSPQKWSARLSDNSPNLSTAPYMHAVPNMIKFISERLLQSTPIEWEWIIKACHILAKYLSSGYFHHAELTDIGKLDLLNLFMNLFWLQGFSRNIAIEGPKYNISNETPENTQLIPSMIKLIKETSSQQMFDTAMMNISNCLYNQAQLCKQFLENDGIEVCKQRIGTSDDSLSGIGLKLIHYLAESLANSGSLDDYISPDHFLFCCQMLAQSWKAEYEHLKLAKLLDLYHLSQSNLIWHDAVKIFIQRTRNVQYFNMDNFLRYNSDFAILDEIKNNLEVDLNDEEYILYEYEILYTEPSDPSLQGPQAYPEVIIPESHRSPWHATRFRVVNRFIYNRQAREEADLQAWGPGGAVSQRFKDFAKLTGVSDDIIEEALKQSHEAEEAMRQNNPHMTHKEILMALAHMNEEDPSSTV